MDWRYRSSGTPGSRASGPTTGFVGLVAVGLVAVGLVAVGLVAVGLVAVGLVAVGLVAVGLPTGGGMGTEGTSRSANPAC